MKKQILSIIIGTIVLGFLFGTLQAQTVTLTFTGRYGTNQYARLNIVFITNLTKGWQEDIYWPDTTLTMQNGTGSGESVANGGFALSQNNPNPFSCTTDVNLTVADAGAVTLEIVDGNGKTVGTHRARPEIGTHQFRVSLSAAGTYVMTARQNGKTSSIKMVCNSGGNANGIDYLGMVQTITYVLKSTTNNPFNFGDMMEYVGYATINGTEVESQRITQAQGASQTFVLQFDVAQVNLDGQPCPGTPTLTDRDGNTYNTVLIGTQCWMKENLRTTKYADGTSISQGSSTSTTTAYWYYPNNNSSNKPTYGLLYNWKAVMRNSSSSSSNPSGVQGICPTGWHVPSDAEWTQLTDYVSSQSEYVCGSDNRYIAKALAGTTGWSSSTRTCAVGNTPSQNNSTGFSALPAGSYYGDYYDFGNQTFFWSATGGDEAYYLWVNYCIPEVYPDYYNKDLGYSVRCLRD